MDYWKERGASGFVLSVGYRWESIRDYFGDAFRGIPVRYATEHSPLGTGGALLLAARILREKTPFLLLNGDTFLQVDPFELTACQQRTGALLTMALTRVDDCGRYGSVELSAEELITGFAEKRQGAGCGLINAGVYLIDPVILQNLPTNQPLSLEIDILAGLLGEGVAMAGCEVNGNFIDIGLPEDYARASSVVGPHD
jgi:D-glycero-alpha-D-manno-heptose 1-phosphate guanylyltransferase